MDTHTKNNKTVVRTENLADEKNKTTGIKHRVQTCPGANPHGKLAYAGFPDLCAMLPDVAVAG